MKKQFKELESVSSDKMFFIFAVSVLLNLAVLACCEC